MSKHCAVALIAFCVLLVLACNLPTPTPAPTPEPTATWTPIPPFPTATSTVTPTPVVIVVTATPEPTPTVTPTPRLVVLPPAEYLAALIAHEYGPGFTYLKLYYVPEDTVPKIPFGWPEFEQWAVFKLVDGEWQLVETRPMETPAPQPGRTWPEGEARSRTKQMSWQKQK